MKKFSLIFALILFSAVGWGQALPYTPPPMATYISPSAGVWNPLTVGGAFGALNYVPPPAGMYCQTAVNQPWTPCTGTGGGGGGLPSAALGQILTNNNGTTGYAGQANILYQQSGDTIASIETACTSAPCTYVVTSPQTITLAASHAMNSNVWLRFEASGSWTVNGATFVLSNVQVAPGTTTTNHFPSGSGSMTLSALNTLVPVEWFGAVGDWNGTTGTNNLTAIQAALNATTYGQAWLQARAYAIGGTLTNNKNSVGIRGTAAGRGGQSSSFAYVSSLVETVAGDSAITETGTSSVPIVQNTYQDFNILPSVSQTGTPAGLSLSFTGGVTVKNVLSQDFFYPFYIHASPSDGNGGFFNDNATWTSLSSAMTSPIGYFLDSGDGFAENSLTLRDDASGQGTGPASSIGAELKGTAINDVDFFNFNTAKGAYGMIIDYTGSGTNFSASDIHCWDCTFDGFNTEGALVENVPAAATGSVEFSGGWAIAAATVAATAIIDCESSSGLSINHMQLGNHAGSSNPANTGVKAAGCSNIGVDNNTFLNQIFAEDFTNTSSGSTFNSNKITNEGGALSTAMQINNASTGIVTNGNTVTGLWTTGLSIASGANLNTYVGNNFASTVTTPINDLGSNNGTGPIKTDIIKASTTTTNNVITADSTGTGTPNANASFLSIGETGFQGNNLGTVTRAYEFGFGIPGSAATLNPAYNFFNGTSWAEVFHVVSPTVAVLFDGAIAAPSVAINGGTAMTSQSTANSQIVTVAPGTRATGFATLAAGTVTITNAAACTPSATCVYKLTRCGLNGATAVGVLGVGTVVSGTSFVINSYTAIAGIAVDTSQVCWQIN